MCPSEKQENTSSQKNYTFVKPNESFLWKISEEVRFDGGHSDTIKVFTNPWV